MSSSPEKRARAEAMLGDLAEVSLMVAKELAVRLRETEAVDETVALAGAFQKVSRVVRLTLALDFKLERDAARDAQAAAREAERIAAETAKAEKAVAQAAPARVNPIEARKTRVSNLLNQLIWNECESDREEYDILYDDMIARLDEAALSPQFETLPIETLVRRIADDMGLSGELTLSLCEPPAGDAGGAPPEPRSSG